ncbi:MAG: phosphoserine phosphatase SerB [Burkholderiales bacterium]|jgi:phosphoserine phosphatase|nr:phosphoserine phosphatase SerB [Burkholderiales bacterium]MCZ8101080.1 phosphoserine phosphatase SerB [Burkholderiales bacterium]
MTRLVVQHPALPDTAVAAFADAVGMAPAVRAGALACWPDAAIDGARVGELADSLGVDAEIVRPGLRLADFRLAAFDMDSTLITIECVDEIADYVGRKTEVAAITEAAMRGEIADYDESLRRRVALLAGLPESTLERVWDERVRLSPGAEALTAALGAAGLHLLVVSGGFTFFTERLKRRLGLDTARSNVLEVVDGRLTGRLLGPIVNAERKRTIVEQTCAQLGCTPAQAIVVGDGANDLKMMSIAGLSVAFHAKPIVRDETTHAINHCGLDAILAFFER